MQVLARRDQGHTLIELTLAITILSIGLLTLVSSLASTQVLIGDNSEYALAYAAARQKLEEMRGYRPFGGIYAHYASGAASAFTVAGLPLQSGTNFQGQILFPDSTSPSVQLYESTNDPELGMPKDLDGDGVIDGNSHAANYKILPVKVRIAWRGAPGTNRQIVVSTWIADK